MRRLYERLIAAEGVIAAVFLVLMVALIFLGAVMRVLGHPVNWSTDAATAFFAWACFLCADIAWRRNSLISVELLVQRLPAGLQQACRMFNYLVICAFLLYVIGVGTWLAWVSRERSFQGIPEVSYSWVTLSMVVGGVLLLVTTLRKVRAELRGARR
jgi:TRAP-type C4-dicarboxylate transport system permease small subunit